MTVLRSELDAALHDANLAVEPLYAADLQRVGRREWYTLEQMVLLETHRQFISKPARQTEKWRVERWELGARIHREIYNREPRPYLTKKQEEENKRNLKAKITAHIARRKSEKS